MLGLTLLIAGVAASEPVWPDEAEIRALYVEAMELALMSVDLPLGSSMAGRPISANRVLEERGLYVHVVRERLERAWIPGRVRVHPLEDGAEVEGFVVAGVRYGHLELSTRGCGHVAAWNGDRSAPTEAIDVDLCDEPDSHRLRWRDGEVEGHVWYAQPDGEGSWTTEYLAVGAPSDGRWPRRRPKLPATTARHIDDYEMDFVAGPAQSLVEQGTGRTDVVACVFQLKAPPAPPPSPWPGPRDGAAIAHALSSGEIPVTWRDQTWEHAVVRQEDTCEAGGRPWRLALWNERDGRPWEGFDVARCGEQVVHQVRWEEGVPDGFVDYAWRRDAHDPWTWRRLTLSQGTAFFRDVEDAGARVLTPSSGQFPELAAFVRSFEPYGEVAIDE